ncbi:WYL domain-containing protein [Castellaniella sp.]|uniref:helix-turn-helix transcriptional regulator n=1 Tax=Castellaniella sp. TaxID=1955812 RepID=UPI002AFE79E4|nr:WYL domain-containing protein [Castellaniella sp.]
MTKRSDTLETVLLVVEILRRIPRKPHWTTASQLHEQLTNCGFNRDLRTIQRQLEMVSSQMDIECNNTAKPYRYRWLEHTQGLAVSYLTAQESLLLRLAQEHLRDLLPAHLMRAMKGLFEQANRTLGPGGTAKLEREWPGKVRVVATSQPLLPPKISPPVFEQVSEALYGNFWLWLDYENAKGRSSEIKVMPLGLAQQGSRLYLVCRYPDYDNERILALHRMRSAKASTLTFTRPSDFDLATYDDKGNFGFGDGSQVYLRFQITEIAGHHLQETPLSRDQQIESAAPGWLQVSATVVDSALLDRWLRGFGADVQAIEKSDVEPTDAVRDADDIPPAS